MYYTLALRAAWWICCGQWLTSGAPRPRAKKVPFCPTERHNDEKGNPLGKLGVSSVHVFISYSHANGDFAEILRTRLEGSGFNVWTDEDRLLAGEDWRNGIDKAIRSACALIVVMTPSAKASEYVTYEWAFAWGVGVKVIPILLEPTPLHPRLEVLQYLDFSIRSARPWDKLLALLKEVSANSRAVLLRGQDDLVSSISGIVRNALSNLDNVDRDIRQKAVEMLASMQDPVARDAVVSALKHPIRDVREAAARALVEIKYPAAVPALIEALRDEDSNVREAAEAALREIKDPDPAAVPALIEALRDAQSNVCIFAAAMLGRIKDPAVVPALIEALRDKDRSMYLRRAAAEALRWIKDPAAVPALIEALRDEESYVREMAAAALG